MLTEAQKKNQSQGERKISDILDAHGVPYEIEYSFPDLVASSGKPLRFDFAVFNDDGSVWFLIEYQGEQHYKAVSHFGGSKGLQRQRHNDSAKAVYCLDNGYPLVAVPYGDYNFLDYDYIMEKAMF